MNNKTATNLIKPAIIKDILDSAYLHKLVYTQGFLKDVYIYYRWWS